MNAYAWVLIGYLAMQVPFQFGQAGKRRHDLTPAWGFGIVLEVCVLVWLVMQAAR